MLKDLKELFWMIKWRIEMKIIRLGWYLYNLLVPKRLKFLFDDDDDEDYGAKFFGKLGTSIPVLFILYMWFRAYTPFGFWEFWHMPGSWVSLFQRYWMLFAWGVIIQSIVSFTGYNSPYENDNAERFLFKGFLRSAFAGVTEEISFRWLFFLSAIPGARIANWFFFGFAGFGVSEWLFLHVVGPITSTFSLHWMDTILYHSAGWFVGAALVSTNAFFRDGHKYQGITGLVNSWYGGLVLFHVALNYGLPAAIVLHTSFNVTVHLVAYIDMLIERTFLGRTNSY